MQVSQNPSQHVLYYQGRYYRLDKAQIVIGSDPRCDICIEDNPHVLPAHARVISQQGQVFLQHLDRNAAIWVNSVPVAETQLQDRAEIAIGDPTTKLLLLNRTHADPAVEDAPRFMQRGPTATTDATQAIQNNPGAATHVLQHTGGMPASTIAAPPSATVLAAPSHAAPAAAPAVSTDTTRYLCAAGHLDEEFQDYVMRHVIHEDRRAMGETYGVDMLAVVSWCKEGRIRINIRDSVLFAFFLLICSLFLIHMFQLIGDFVQQYNQYNQYYGQYAGFILQLLLSVGLGTVLAILFVLLTALGIEAWIRHRWPRSHPGFVSLFVLFVLLGLYTNFLVAFLLILALWLTIFLELLARYYGEPTTRLRRGEFEKNLRPVTLDFGLESKLRENFTTRQRNVVAYSGYAPFAGTGYDLGGWSFVVDTTRGAQREPLQDEHEKPLPFTVSELYDTVQRALEGLGLNDVLEIEGKLYVNGQRLLENPPFFNATALRPVTSVDQVWVGQFKEHPTEDVRYYQCIRFNFWRGEMVFTAFLRSVRRGKNLFTEVDYLLLPPLKPDYYWVDKKEVTPTAGKVWELFKRSFDAPLKMWFGVPGRLLRGPIYGYQQRRLVRVARNNPSFDYGAATSLRQVASDDEYHLFFQKLDKEMYLKIVEQQLLETIIQFLDEHHIDTTELRNRQEMILNAGVTVQGDTVNIGSVASGAWAHATNINVAAAAATTTRQTQAGARS